MTTMNLAASKLCPLWLLCVLTKLVMLTDALPSEPYLIYSNLTNIGSVDLKNLAKTNILSGSRSIIALDVDRIEKKIYYGEHSLGKMYRVNMDGTNKELFLSGVGKVEGIAIDWVARLIYWTAYTSGKIEVATLDGKHRMILLNTGLEYPRGMAVDPEEGYLFWSDWGTRTAIERCTLAGGNRIALVKNDIVWPNGITVDYVKKRLYWIDAFHDTITSIDYNGGQRTKLFEDKTLDVSQFHGFDLDIIHNVMYWTDWSRNAIFGLNQTKLNATIFRNITIQSKRKTKGIMGIVVVDPVRQPSVINRCASSGSCEQLCLLEPNGFKCACGISFQLAEDGKSCNDAFKDEFIMFADGGAGKIYQLQVDSDNVEPMAIKFGPDANISRPIALEFDPLEDRVYWTDVRFKSISRAFRNGTGFQTLHSDKVGTADGLTVDLAGRNLFWTSTTHNTIEVSRFNGSFRRVLIGSKLDEPRDIIVDPVGGYMYWTDWGIPKIEQAYMDGTHRKELVNRTIRWPNGLTIDHVYNKLYWADAYEDSIEFLNLESGQRDVLINKKFIIFGFLFRASNQINHPFGLTLLHDHVYWTDWRTNSVYRAERNSGANVTLLAGGFSKPMDIHAYSVKAKQEYHITYTFVFPRTGSDFSCTRNRSCPVLADPPVCPKGYNSSRVGVVCGLYCREIVGYRYRCPCTNWKECAVKQTYNIGCALSYYATFKVRECVKVVKPGRCPYNANQGSQKVCVNDEGCAGDEKCCKGKCVTTATIASHPCQTNNGECDQLCLAIPGGHHCGCINNLRFNETLKKCTQYVAPTTVAPTKPTGLCPSLSPPANGAIKGSCNRTISSVCAFECNAGYRLNGSKDTMCLPFSIWTNDVPKCENKTNPVFLNCPANISVPTDPGVSTKMVSWTSPTATDDEGKPATVTVKPFVYVPPVKFKIGKRMIEYKAVDDEDRTTYCRFYVEVKDEEPPSYGSTCPGDIINYTGNKDNVLVTWTDPIFTDNSGEVSTITGPSVVGPTFPVGKTTIRYTATDGVGLTTICSFTIEIINLCSATNCRDKQTCVVNNNAMKCVCDITCTSEYKPVCGIDGKTYSNNCTRELAMCDEDKTISIIKEGECGCENLEQTKAFQASSKFGCSVDVDVVQCKVECLATSKAAIPDFLNLMCDAGKSWIRRNSNGKYVPIIHAPRCYQTTTPALGQTINDKCPTGSEFRENTNECVPCPPGSFLEEETSTCKECDINQYQDSPSKTKCEICTTENKTSTTTGAENCFFDYGRSFVRMSFSSEKKVDLPKTISQGLTEYCSKSECSFTDPKSSRKKRANENIVFKEEHVIVLSHETRNELVEVIVKLFVLDPTSKSPVPNKALSTKDFEDLLLKISPGLPFPVKLIDDKEPAKTSSHDGKSGKSKAGTIVGVVFAVLVIFGLAIAVFLYTHKQRQNRRLENDTVPPVKFRSNSPEGVMQIGSPVTIPDHHYENPDVIENGVRHGFVNQVYADVNAPPPYYPATPSGATVDTPPVYDTPYSTEAGALPIKEPLPEDGVVELIPPKQVDLPRQKSAKEDFPVQFFHKRSPGNVYTTARDAEPHYDQPEGAEASLKLDPPPKYDDTQLRFMREKTSSSILPNAPKKKKATALDDNANQQGQGSSQSEPATRSVVQTLEDVTKEQSES